MGPHPFINMVAAWWMDAWSCVVKTRILFFFSSPSRCSSSSFTPVSVRCDGRPDDVDDVNDDSPFFSIRWNLIHWALSVYSTGRWDSIGVSLMDTVPVQYCDMCLIVCVCPRARACVCVCVSVHSNEQTSEWVNEWRKYESKEWTEGIQVKSYTIQWRSANASEHMKTIESSYTIE